VAREQEQQSRHPPVAHPSPPSARLRDAGAAERVREGEPKKEQSTCMLIGLGLGYAMPYPCSPLAPSMHTMVLLGDEAQVDAHLMPFGDSAYLDAR
jgi:hypothetical protein